MSNDKHKIHPASEISDLHSSPMSLRVAICGDLPTAYDFLLSNGVVLIDQYEDATELTDETLYHLILIYAPNAEGILDTVYSRKSVAGKGKVTVPIRLLNEPSCDSALRELKSMIRRISKSLSSETIAPALQ